MFGAGEDFNYPATTGDRPQKTWAEKQIAAYIADLLEMAPHDASVFADIMPVRPISVACSLHQGSARETDPTCPHSPASRYSSCVWQ